MPSMENMPQHITPFCQLIPLKNKQDPNPCIPAFDLQKQQLLKPQLFKS
ncbi:hypothetical protein JCM19237_4385 [Photobacterium aphoticum]|uniref:Uncharacterized protein n=1 Tax=Photobacterium aphoticum TaxID=754436 RepID=A0A090QT87_9GAMM|nr:hypothetical protein JCM19237_4385 [Photobacterium aphoticum]